MLSKKDVFFCATWIMLCAAGMQVLSEYVSKPGISARASTPIFNGKVDDSPAARILYSNITLAKDRPTLVMVLHPQCPCSTTSVDNLASIVQQTHGNLKTYALFVRPKDFPEDWAKSKLWKSASAIPGVTPIIDNDGIISNRLGALTSGQTFLYSPDGALQFSGGITFGRGHAGNNDGMESVINAVNGIKVAHAQTSVFGCSLVSCSTASSPHSAAKHNR